jgi:type II secretory pathway pseudopilin PulG
MGRREGWTLPELAAGLLVMAVISMVIVNQIADLKRRAGESSLRGDLADVRGAVALYFSDTQGTYPIDLNIAFAPGSKYMNGLPENTIPAVPAYGNPGHDRPMSSVQGYGEVPGRDHFKNEGESLFGYVVNAASPRDVRVIVNCQHRDTLGENWTNR